MIVARHLPALFVLALTPAGLAVAQAAPGAPPPGGGLATQLIFMLGFLGIFYFFLIRPQQQRAKKHAEMLAALKRGDTIVTSGGLIGKINKVNDNELLVDLADNVRVRVVKGMVVEVRTNAAPVAAAND
jgi:preprotein translocase subunit YajC